MLKNPLLQPIFILWLALLIFSHSGIAQQATYVMGESESAFVMIQLKSPNGKGPTDISEPDVLNVVNQVKSINAKLGYKEFDKKMASFTLDTLGQKIAYLTIRNFNDFSSAEAYAEALHGELDKGIYGKIKSPFPISQSDYKRCVVVKSFQSYYKDYSKGKK